MSNTIETLEIEIIGSSQSAEKALGALEQSLSRLKAAVKGGCGLTAVTHQLTSVNTALGSVNSSGIANLKGLADGLKTLSGIGKFKLSSSVANQITGLGIATKSLNGTDFSKLTDLAHAVSPLASVGKANLGSAITQLGKLPVVIQPLLTMDMSSVKGKIDDLVGAVKPLSEMKKANLSSTINQIKKLPDAFITLDKIDMSAFEAKIRELTVVLKPLADEMQKVANGFSAFPAKIQKLLDGTNKLPKANEKAGLSYVNLAAKLKIAYTSLKRVSSVVASWINKSNEYIENLNLFTVALGEYAAEAKEYAETVGEVMGIDPGEWMRNQGVFMTLATGFGVVNDRAYTMGKNLTQLGYDLSSFFNITYEDAMQKLQSGISGELEPLRRLGYDLSQAKLKAVALSLGIDKTVSSMTQAEKAELRYYAIMTQVTTAQGDMARTLDAPANQLRILKAQVTQAARAIGNIFIPVLTKVLPYVIAFARLIRDLATEIASFFGFSLPEVDYSGIDAVAGSASDASDSLDDATESAKKLKKTVLGIDELNLLTDNSSAKSELDIAGSGAGFDFELPEYTFLDDINENVDAIYEKLKVILEPVGTILEYLYEYKAIVIAALGIKAITKLWGKVKNVWGKFLKLKIVDAFLGGFKTIRKDGGSFLEALNGGITGIRDNLSGIQKAAIVAVAGFAEFYIIEDSVKDLVTGTGNVGTNIAKIGGASVAAAGVMYTALGPYGLALAAVVGLGGAIVGITEAYDQMCRDVVNATFFDGEGTSLDTFKKKLELVTEEFSAQNGQIVTWKQQLDANQGTFDNITLEIQTLSATLGSTGVVTAGEIEKIKGQFGLLYECIQEKMTLSEQVILTALVGALQRATPEISAEIDTLIGEYQRYVRETKGRSEELYGLINNAYDSLPGLSKDDPVYKETMENISLWYQELGDLSGSMGVAGMKWKETVEDFNNGKIDIDFGGNVEKAKEKIGEIATVGKTALDDLATARTTVLLEIEDAIRYASKWKPEDVEMLCDVKQMIEDDYAAQEQAIKDELNYIFGAIQEGAIDKIYDTKQNLEDEWDNLSWFGQQWEDSEAEYVEHGLGILQGYINTISSAIQGHMEQLEMDGSVWADDAMQGIMDKLFDTKMVRSEIWGSDLEYSFAMELEDAVVQVFDDLEKSGKKTASAAGEEITNGLIEGINTPDLSPEGARMVTTLDEALCHEAEINSPSRLFAREGGYIMDGLVNGIKDKVNALKDTMSSLIGSAFSTRSADSYGYSFGETFGKAIVRAIKHISFPTIKGVVNATDNAPSVSFKAYATGGYPDSGQMFLAREAGPELVGTIGSRTAVVNNEQIVESVSQGVYDANGEQNALLREQNNLLRKLLEKDTDVTAVITTGDVISGFERKNRRDGRTIVSVGV